MRRMSGRVLFFGAFAGGALIGWLIRFPPNDSASAAGWTQVVGTIAAIVGAVSVTRMQINHSISQQERDHARDRSDRLRGIVALAAKLQNACGRTQQVVKRRLAQSEDFRDAISGFVALSEGGIKALGEIPLHEPPYVGIAREVIVVQRALFLYQRRISKLLTDAADQGETVRKAQLIVEKLSVEVERLRSRVERVLAGTPPAWEE